LYDEQFLYRKPITSGFKFSYNNPMHTKFWPEKLKGGNHSEKLGVDGRIILEWIVGKYG
jgi:hypothetical protein